MPKSASLRQTNAQYGFADAATEGHRPSKTKDKKRSHKNRSHKDRLPRKSRKDEGRKDEGRKEEQGKSKKIGNKTTIDHLLLYTCNGALKKPFLRAFKKDNKLDAKKINCSWRKAQYGLAGTAVKEHRASADTTHTILPGPLPLYQTTHLAGVKDTFRQADEETKRMVELRIARGDEIGDSIMENIIHMYCTKFNMHEYKTWVNGSGKFPLSKATHLKNMTSIMRQTSKGTARFVELYIARGGAINDPIMDSIIRACCNESSLRSTRRGQTKCRVILSASEGPLLSCIL